MASTQALLTRSLRTDARLLRTHITRLVFAALVYVVAVSVQQAGALGAPGLFFFQRVVWLNFILITGTGLGYLASVITEEKEEGMLGLLRLAGVNAMSLLLGKTIPRLLSIALLRSVQLPFALFGITLGGITIRQILAAYCALFAYLVLLAAAGFLASVVCRRTQRASSLVLIFVLCYLVALPLTRTALLRSGTAIPAPVRESLDSLLDRAIQTSAVERIRETLQADLQITSSGSSPRQSRVGGRSAPDRLGGVRAIQSGRSGGTRSIPSEVWPHNSTLRDATRLG